MDFAQLLKLIDQNTKIPRLRFLSPHPKDMSERVLGAMAEGKSICEHLHLPLQSGSTRILQRMKRGYSAEQFLDLVDRARKAIKGLTISTDIIVGFPGEKEEDFQETLSLVKEIRFDSAFTYRYSPRQGTEAFYLPDDVSPEEKRERNIEPIHRFFLSCLIGLVEPNQSIGRQESAINKPLEHTFSGLRIDSWMIEVEVLRVDSTE
ncbi:MAG: hypothetical protein B1H40_04060 [Candidatus Latescibacteria bacterium 4484_181]|nr:MAG: hypothetical protein B1H40_04060 [Candidatus Latescibacteria bacterium 4484_181]